jgi:hypothetical protein
MRRSIRFVISLLLVSVLVLLSVASVSANKRLYQGRLTTDAELHEVVGSNARGSIVVSSNPDGSYQFQLFVRGLSGPATAAHIHGLATEAENAGVLFTLCGAPPPSAGGACVMDGDTLTVEGRIDSTMLIAAGMTGRQFVENIEAGLFYANVHTSLNPAGETRGQIYPR